MPSTGPASPGDLYAELLGLNPPRACADTQRLERDVEATLQGNPHPLAEHLHKSGLRDIPAATRVIQGLADDPLALDRLLPLLAHLLEPLASCADADMALRNLDRYSRVVFDRSAFYGQLTAHTVLIR